MLEVSDLRLSIQDSVILNGVSFRVNEGETVGIIGPNGSGKTTLFNCISGFHFPSSGRISFRDQEITRRVPSERAKLGLGRVFQNSGVFQEMTVLENMVTAIEGRQSPWKTFFPWSTQARLNEQASLNYLKEIKLETKAQLKAASLSGGEKRLLEIMRTLAFGADLFLLDEPTAGVSPKMKDDVAALIVRLQQLKKTVIVIEHDIVFIEKFCSRIVVLDVGVVVLDNTPDKVKSDPRLREIYFGNGKQ